MRLLVLTQKVDLNDSVLGFFHGWLIELAKRTDHITVVCLEKGFSDLTKNINVVSLGKDSGKSRREYVLEFYRIIWQERKKYDVVFVHMNQEYVVLGGLFWRLWNKKIFFWRNHPSGSIITWVAAAMSYRIFCTSIYSYTAKFSKTKIMPVGIDTGLFTRDQNITVDENSLMFLGRISPIKKLNIFLEALDILKKDGIIFSAKIVGDPTVSDNSFYVQMKELSHNSNLSDNVSFEKGVPNKETPLLYNRSAIYVNLTEAGSMDKTIFEAMSCESLVLVSNKSLRGEIDDIFIVDTLEAESVAAKLKNLLILNKIERSKLGLSLRQFVEQKHSLLKLVDMLIVELEK